MWRIKDFASESLQEENYAKKEKGYGLIPNLLCCLSRKKDNNYEKERKADENDDIITETDYVSVCEDNLHKITEDELQNINNNDKDIDANYQFNDLPEEQEIEISNKNINEKFKEKEEHKSNCIIF